MQNEGWKLRDIYLYLVSLITLVMMVVGALQLVGNLGEYFFQAPNYYPTLMEIENRYRYEDQSVPPLEELKQAQAEEIEAEQKRQHRYILRKIIDSLALILIPLPIYLLHWRKTQGEKQEEEDKQTDETV